MIVCRLSEPALRPRNVVNGGTWRHAKLCVRRKVAVGQAIARHLEVVARAARQQLQEGDREASYPDQGERDAAQRKHGKPIWVRNLDIVEMKSHTM